MLLTLWGVKLQRSVEQVTCTWIPPLKAQTIRKNGEEPRELQAETCVAVFFD